MKPGISSAVPRALVIIIAAALLARVAVVVSTPHFRPINDPADYDRIAQSIARGHGYPATNFAAPGTPSAWRPPAYPTVLAAAYVIGGHNWTLGRLLGALLGVATVLLIFLVAQLAWDRRVALAAAALAAVFPPLVLMNASLLSESLFLPCELATLLAVLMCRRRGGSVKFAVLAGMLCGVAMLTRPVGIVLLIPAAWGILLTAGVGFQRRLRTAAIMTLAAAATVTPWTVRNAVALHAFVPISTEGGLTFAGTYNDVTSRPGPARGIWTWPGWLPEFRSLFGSARNEAEVDAVLRRRGLDYALGHPAYVGFVVGANGLRLFGLGPGHTITNDAWYNEMGVPRGARDPSTVSVLLLIVFAITGAAILHARRRPWLSGDRFLWLMPVLLCLAVVWAHGDVRTRLPADPFLVMLCGLVGVGLLSIYRERSAQSTRTPPLGPPAAPSRVPAGRPSG